MRNKPKRVAIAIALGLALGVASASVAVVSAMAEAPREGYAPDPPALANTKQWFFRVDVKAGKPSITSIIDKNLAKPEPTPRMMGRYALELWVGKELLDRIRFNVPGTGDGPRRDDKNILKRPQLDRINTHFTVRMADNERARFAKLVDRATGDEEIIPWPPGQADAGLIDAVASDAGSSDAGKVDGGKPADGGPADAGFPKGDAAAPPHDAAPAPPWDGNVKPSPWDGGKPTPRAP